MLDEEAADYGAFKGTAVLKAIDKGEFAKPREHRPNAIPEGLDRIILQAMDVSPEAPSSRVRARAAASGAREPAWAGVWKKYYFHSPVPAALPRQMTSGIAISIVQDLTEMRGRRRRQGEQATEVADYRAPRRHGLANEEEHLECRLAQCQRGRRLWRTERRRVRARWSKGRYPKRSSRCRGTIDRSRRVEAPGGRPQAVHLVRASRGGRLGRGGGDRLHPPPPAGSPDATFPSLRRHRRQVLAKKRGGAGSRRPLANRAGAHSVGCAGSGFRWRESARRKPRRRVNPRLARRLIGLARGGLKLAPTALPACDKENERGQEGNKLGRIRVVGHSWLSTGCRTKLNKQSCFNTACGVGFMCDTVTELSSLDGGVCGS